MSDNCGCEDGEIFEWPMAGFEVPDVPEPLVGYKTLYVDDAGLLYSSVGPASFGSTDFLDEAIPPWPTDGPLRALCPQGHRPPCRCVKVRYEFGNRDAAIREALGEPATL